MEKVKCNGVFVKRESFIIKEEVLKRLKNIADCINTYAPNIMACVEETWMDYGARISWLTIVVHERYGEKSYQLLAPVEMVAIIEGDYDTNLRFVIEKIAEIKERGW